MNPQRNKKQIELMSSLPSFPAAAEPPVLSLPCSPLWQEAKTWGIWVVEGKELWRGWRWKRWNSQDPILCGNIKKIQIFYACYQNPMHLMELTLFCFTWVLIVFSGCGAKENILRVAIGAVRMITELLCDNTQSQKIPWGLCPFYSLGISTELFQTF